MSPRLAVVLLLSIGFTLGHGIACAKAKPVDTRERDAVGATAARDRQKRCVGEWRGLSAVEKAAKGPGWPQFYSRCVKRLKEPKA